MSEIKTTLNILIESLGYKKDCLIRIIKLSKEQEELLMKEEFDNKSFSRTVNNKQVQIDKVKALDAGFQPAFNRIKGTLNNNPDLYKAEIETLKNLIKDVGELGIEIEVLEQRNKVRFEIVSTKVKDTVKTFKKSKHAASNYYSTMKKIGGTEGSYFFDSKK